VNPRILKSWKDEKGVQYSCEIIETPHLPYVKTHSSKGQTYYQKIDPITLEMGCVKKQTFEVGCSCEGWFWHHRCKHMDQVFDTLDHTIQETLKKLQENKKRKNKNDQRG